MGCKQFKIRPSVLDSNQRNDVGRKSESLNKFNGQPSLSVAPKLSIDLSPIDNEAYSTTVCRQRQTAIDNMGYRKAIDKWCPSFTEELIGLIQKLSVDKSQIDRAWIIFYWISQNIRYDTEAYFSNQIGAQNADNVLQSRKAVCDGYSSLYAELCNRTGLKCRKVSGYSKGFGFNTRQTKFDETDHAWNILTLDNGHSYFVESTWGSGHLDNATRQYKQNLVPHYFLCRPEHMIYGHLPEDDQCQLLMHPLTVKQYLMLPNVYSAFYTLDLQIVSPVYSPKVDLVNGKSYGLVLIRTLNNNVEVSGSLKDEANNKIEGGNMVYLDKEDQTLWRCQFAPPKPGKYNIFIYAREKNAQNQPFAAVVQFSFDVDRLSSPPISYPVTWPHFFDYNLEIIKPMNSRYLDWPSKINNSYGEILVRSPDNVCISATMKDTSTAKNEANGTFVNFDHAAKLWQCLFVPSSTGVSFELTLFAQRSDEDKSHCVTQFSLRPIPMHSWKRSVTFPQTYVTFSSNKCHLFEPLDGVLRSGSTIHFRCQVPRAREVNITVDGNWINGDALKPDENDVFNADIQVGQQEIVVWVKFDDENSSYSGLLKYTVC
jgi:hypothetical protein